MIGEEDSPRRRIRRARGRSVGPAFCDSFLTNPAEGLVDCVDGGVSRRVDPSEPALRRQPSPFDGARRRWRAASSTSCRRELLTPFGLRTLSPQRSRLPRALRRWPRGARFGLSPGHRVALADRGLRDGLPPRQRGRTADRDRAIREQLIAPRDYLPARRTRPASRRSSTATRRTARAAVSPRPGASPSSSASPSPKRRGQPRE